MNSFLGLFADAHGTAEPPRVIPIREQVHPESFSPSAAIRDEQIHALVQQVFFTHASNLVRHVGFVTIDGATEIAPFCLDVAKALAQENAHDIGLIDARPDSLSLQARLKISGPKRVEGNWLIAPRLWIVPRQSWLPGGRQRVTEQDSERLHEIAAEFDFSILCCAPVSWLTTSIAHVCDGIVLVLTANKTRRLVAAQIKEHLQKSHIPLLGTVLLERRFPVPQSLYRSL